MNVIDSYNVMIAAFILGVLRIAGFKSTLYQAVAHMFVGGLFAFWFAIQQTSDSTSIPRNIQDNAIIAWYTAWALSILELICFLYDKFGGGL